MPYFAVLLLLYFVVCQTNSLSYYLSIVRTANNSAYTIPNDIYRFRDNETVLMECILNCTDCTLGSLHNIKLKNSNNDYTFRTKVTLEANSTVKLSKTFTLHKNDTAIVCEASCLYNVGCSNVTARIQLKYLSQNREDKQHEEKQFESSFESPKIKRSVFKDTRIADFAMFTCTARRERLALISWHQIKGSERVVLKTVAINSSTSETIYFSTLNKIISMSDKDTELYCVARYFLDGPQLSNRIISKKINLSFDRYGTFQASSTGANHLLSYSGLLTLLAVIGSITIVALIVVVILVTVIMKFKRRVKEYERDETWRNRQPLPRPPSENVYDTVYGHGAGLKRPRKRPT